MPQVVIVSSLGPQGQTGPQGPIGPTGSFDNITGSFVTTSSFNAFTSSYNTASFTGSFVGSGAGLYNIPASGITGLNLSQIATGSVTASVSTGTGSFTITSGSTNLLFVSSSGNVGIGTNAPTQKLHVNNGNAFINGTIYFGNSSHYLTTDNSTYAMLSSNRTLQLSTNGNPVVSVFTTQNVSIGNTTDSARLFIKGSGATSSTTALLVQNSDNTFNFSIKDNGDLTSNNNFVTINGYDTTITGANKVAINGTNFNTGYIYRGVTSGFLTLGNDSTVSTGITLYGSTHATLRDSIRINQSGSTVVTIVSGSVGIGTTTPAYRLDTSGSGNFTSNLTVTGSLITSVLTASNAIISGNVTVLGTASINTLIVNQTQLSTGSNQLGDAADDFQTLYGTVRIPTGSLTVTGSITQTASTASFGGVVGIGTSSPAYKLDVNGVARVGASGSSGQLYIKGFVGAGQYLYLDDGATVWSLVGGGSYSIQENGINRFSVRGGGNVGVGVATTTSITSRLQVRGSGTTDATTAFRVENANASSSMVVLDNGNVGIGTTSPTAKLQIKGTGDSSVWITTDDFNGGTNAGSVIRIGTRSSTGNTAGWIDTLNNGYSSYGNLMLNAFGGNILIGTITDAGYKLDVNGSVRIKGAGTTDATTAFRVENANASSSMVVLDNGNVGIGTATPLNKLHVLGNAGDILYILADTGQSAVIGATGTGTNRMYIGYSPGTENIAITSGNVLRLNPGGSGNVLIGTATDAGYKTYISGTSTSGSLNVNDTLHVSGSKVGISTSTPAYTLDVSGSGNFSNSLTVTGSLTVSGSSTFTNIGPAVFSGSITQTASTASFGGLVGIGTTTPTAPLEVRGATNFSTVLRIGGLNSGRDFTFNPYYATSVYGGFFGNDSGHITLGASLGTDNGSGIGIYLGGPSGNRTALLQLKGTGTTSSTTALLVQNANASASFSVKDNGYVEISNSTGVNIPFKVFGQNSGLSVYTNFSNTINALTLETNTNYGNRITFYNTSYGSTYHIGQAYFGNRLAVYDNTYTELTSWDLANMRVGIGTTTPAAKLHISGSSGSVLLEVDSNSQQNILYVSGSGNVGIGTGNPTYALELSGSIGNQGVIKSRRLIAYGGTANDPPITTTSTIAGLFEAGYAELGFSSYAGEAGRIEGASRLWNIGMTGGTAKMNIRGTGTTSSTTALLVQNSSATPSLTIKDDLTTTFGGNLFTANNSVISGSFSYSGGDFIKIHGLNTNGQAKIVSYDYGAARTTELAFGSGDSHWRGLYKFSTNGYYLTDSVGSVASYERLRIDYLGRVGISNPNPSYRLDVSGSSNFTGNVLITGSVNIDGGLFDTVSTGSIPTGSTLIYTINTGSYQAGFFDYYVSSGSNFRAGNIMSVWGAGTYKFTDLATPDIGSTSNLQFSMSLSASSAQLFASASSAGWTVKTTFRTI